ncbi:MAG: hypothetical protein GY765_23440, partial [bacterium]|nr:hypothetical protein [bacterium]
MNLIKQTQAFRVLLWGILLFSLFFNGLPIQAETQCYSERIKDAPTFNIYSGKDHPNNPITWTHNVPPGILDSTMRVGIYIEAYDVDYPVGDEHDRVYFNGVDLGLLEGTNDGWITVEKTIPVSAIQEGVNTVQIYVDELGVGWKTKVRKSELRFYCSSSAPDFSLGVSPPTQQIDQGESTSYTVSLTALNSFASPVDLTVEGLPTGAAGTFTLNPLTPAPTGDTTLTITTDVSTPAGTYPLTIKAKADGIEHSQQVSLKIIALPVPDFTISATPEGRAIIRGNADDFTVNLGAVDGFDSAVNLSVSGLPANTTSAFSLNPLTPTGDTTLTITTTLDSPEGTYPLTIFGEGGGKTHTAQVILKVKPLAVEPDFKLETTPDLRILVQGDNTDYHVKLTALDGFSSAVDLSISGLPSGVTTQFTLDNLTPTAQSVLKVFTTADAAVGRHTLTITAVGGGKTHSKEITLKIEER